MKLIKSTLIAAAVAATMTGSAFSQTEKAAPEKIQNIVTVNVQKLLKDFHKTQDAMKKLGADELSIQEANTTRLAKVKDMEKVLTDLKKKVEDSATPDATRKQLAENYQLKQSELLALEKERREYVERRLKTLNSNKQQQMNLLYEEIVKVINDKAAKEKYDLVIDASAASAGLGNKVFMFVKESADVTPEILKELNKDAPAGFDPEKAPEVPAPAPAPVPAN